MAGSALDFDTYEVFIGGQTANPSLREFELLKFFVPEPVSRVRPPPASGPGVGQRRPRRAAHGGRHIRRLRKRIERDDANPELIVTVRGVGYKFNPDALGA